MRKLTRIPCPKVLVDKGQKWTKRMVDKGQWTAWPQDDNKKLNHILRDEGLKEQTQAHCSYCDRTPVDLTGVETIDHFRPKSKFLPLALEWTNLFYCCSRCQSVKREKYDDDLLKPDAEDYDFDRYFMWKFETGELLPNDVAPEEMQQRARYTISTLKLSDKHPAWRLKELHIYRALGLMDLDDRCYRDFLERAI